MADAKSRTPEQLQAQENLQAAVREKEAAVEATVSARGAVGSVEEAAFAEFKRRILRRRNVERITGLSRSTIYAMIADGEFPKPIKLGKRAVGWREADIVAWLESREQRGA